MTNVDAAPGTALSRRELYSVFAGLMTGLFLAALDGTIVNTALTTIIGDLGGVTAFTWVGTAYLLTSTAATPLFGKLSDLYGRRQLFQTAIATFVAGSAACGLAQSMGQLVGARALQGIGGGGLLAMSFIIIGDVVPPRERGRYVGFFTSVFAFASVAGPLLGGFFVDQLSWRWIFLVNIPLGIVAWVVVSASLRLPFVRQDRAVDWGGAALLVTSVTSLVLALSWASERYGWGSSVTVGLLCAAGLSTAAFLWWEGRATEPIVPLRLFHNEVFRIIVPMMVCLGTIMFGTSAFVPLYLQGVTGVSPTASGLLLLPLMAGVSLSAIWTGRRTAATGRYRRWPIMGTGIGVVGLSLLLFMGTEAWQLALTLTGLGLLGIGMGATMPTSTLAVQNAVEWQDLGIATSLVTFFRSLGGAVGLAAFGAVFNAQLTGRIDTALVRAPRQINDLPPALYDQALTVLADAITAVFLVAIPIMGAAFVLSWFVKELPLRETSAMQRGQVAQAEAAPPFAVEANPLAGS